MEKSASEPVLLDSDYHLQKWGHPRKVPLGKSDQDTGEHTSLINRIQKQARKTPAPDKYQGHVVGFSKTDGGNQGSVFTKESRFYKDLNKVPAPSNYDRKDISTLASMKGRDNLSNIRRVPLGRMSTGKKMSFIEKSIKFSLTLPGPGNYSPQPKKCDRPDSHVKKTLDWRRQMQKTTSPMAGKHEEFAAKVSPSTYHIDRSPTEVREPIYSVPKDPHANFLDKAVKETMVDHRQKKELPAPATYFKDGTFNVVFNQTKLSHGPVQKSSIARSHVSSYF